MKVETSTNFVLTLAIIGDTNNEAIASPTLTALDKNAIYPWEMFKSAIIWSWQAGIIPLSKLSHKLPIQKKKKIVLRTERSSGCTKESPTDDSIASQLSEGFLSGI